MTRAVDDMEMVITIFLRRHPIPSFSMIQKKDCLEEGLKSNVVVEG